MSAIFWQRISTIIADAVAKAYGSQADARHSSRNVECSSESGHVSEILQEEKTIRGGIICGNSTQLEERMSAG